MPVTHALAEVRVKLVARRFHLIGEPMRVLLLDRLRADEQGVGGRAAALGASHQNVPEHLHRAGTARGRNDGNPVVHTIADTSVFSVGETVCGDLLHQVADLPQILEEPRELQGAVR